MFRRLEDARPEIVFDFEGREVVGREGDTVAAALLAAGLQGFRTTTVSGAARAPYCMMGVCFECLMEIDGMASQQACMVMLNEGMAVRRQTGARELAGVKV